MFSHTELGNAIQQSLENNSKIVAFTGHGDYDPTMDENKVGIGEYIPNVTAPDHPYVGWHILESEPISQNQAINHWHVSMVWIFGVATNSLSAAKLTDLIQYWFTSPNTDETLDENAVCHTWFRDISNTCIFNRFTTYTGRRKFGQAGIHAFEEETDTWREAVAIKIVWRDFNCDGEACGEIEDSTCNNEDTEYDDDCPNC